MSDTELARRVAMVWEWFERAIDTSTGYMSEKQRQQWAELRVKHGLVPPPAVGKGERWWVSQAAKWQWHLRSDGVVYSRSTASDDEWRVSHNTIDQLTTEKCFTETDAHGAPLAVPAATGAGLRFGAEIVRRDDHFVGGAFSIRAGGYNFNWWRDRPAWWEKTTETSKGLVYADEVKDEVIAALSAAPAPPGWKEPAATRDGMEERAKDGAQDAWAESNIGVLWYRSPGLRGGGQVLSDKANVHLDTFRRWHADHLLAFARSETSALAAENERLRKELEQAVRVGEHKLSAWSRDARTIRLCRILAAHGIPYDYSAPTKGDAENERLRGRVAELEAMTVVIDDAKTHAIDAMKARAEKAEADLETYGGWSKWQCGYWLIIENDMGKGASFVGDTLPMPKRKPSPRRAPARGKTKGKGGKR